MSTGTGSLAIVGLGSNQGDRAAILDKALDARPPVSRLA